MNTDLRDLIDEVKAHTPTEAIIGARVKLTRKGRLQKALCPLHDEDTPSFTLYSDGRWHCFGCDRSGDVIAFVMETEGLSFWDALQELAGRAGVRLPQATPDQRRKAEERRATEGILTDAASFYSSQLTTEARTYLYGRGLTDETIERFQVGYAPGHSALKTHLLSLGYSEEQCIQAGVLAVGDAPNKQTRDFLFRRVVFPAMKFGRAVFLIGRALDDSTQPKYLGLPIPKDEPFNSAVLSKKHVVAVEGLLDCMVLDQAGIPAVALMGTAFSAEFAQRFARCERVTLCLDGDEAGKTNALKIADLLGDKARIVSLPEGMDPDQYLIEHGKEAFESLLKGAVDTITYLVEAIDPDTNKVQLARELEPVLRRLAAISGVMAEAYLTDLIKRRFHLTRDDIGGYRKLLKSYSPKEEAAIDGSTPLEYSARFPGLVDIVEQDGLPAYLIKHPQSGELLVVSRWECDGHIYVPPTIDQIPWLLPNAERVLASIEQAAVMSIAELDCALFADLVLYHKGISEMPSEEHYTFLATWDLHTYLLEHFEYSPIFLLHADPEKGKTRTLKGITYVMYRGVHVESLREASLIRYAQHFRASLSFDVKDLWRKAEGQGSEDILLLRFEKGARVARVLYPEKGAFQDTVFFEVFGPTVIATNEAVDRILETRAVAVSMPETARRFETDVKPETSLPMKERLLAFRARHMDTVLPECDKPANGRLGDILKPLAQVLMLVAPGQIERFNVLVRHLQAGRLVEKADTLEAKVLRAVAEAERDVEGGTLTVEAILSVLNNGRSDKYAFKAESVGRRLKSLGFEKKRITGGLAAIVWDGELVKKLCVKYGLSTPGKLSLPSLQALPSSLTPVQWPGEALESLHSWSQSGSSERSDSSDGSVGVYPTSAHTQSVNGNGASNGHKHADAAEIANTTVPLKATVYRCPMKPGLICKECTTRCSYSPSYDKYSDAEFDRMRAVDIDAGVGDMPPGNLDDDLDGLPF